jgi:hypothetical protein
MLFGMSGCVSARGIKKLRVVTDTWSVVQIADSNEYVIVAKGRNDLERALESMGCDAKPCTIGRLGNVYSVTTIGTPQESSQPSPLPQTPAQQ